MSLIAEWRARVTEERVDALIVQASDLLEVAAMNPTTLPGQRARRQASYLRTRALEIHRANMLPEPRTTAPSASA